MLYPLGHVLEHNTLPLIVLPLDAQPNEMMAKSDFGSLLRWETA
jgi:hypothetical protein